MLSLSCVRSATISSLLMFGLAAASPMLIAAEESQRLRPPDVTVGEEYENSAFGQGIDLEDERLAVGAPGLEAAYVFERQDGEWVDVAKVQSPTEDGFEFGTRVALDENVLAISAPAADVDGVASAGAVYVYDRGADNSEWEFRGRLTAEIPITEGYFGSELAADNGLVAVLARGANATAYLFEYDPHGASWKQVVESAGMEPEPDRRNAPRSNIDLSGDTFLHLRYSDGVVLVHERVGAEWHITQELTESSAIDAVGVDGDLLATGEGGVSTYEPSRGEGLVHIYERIDDQWIRVQSVQHDPTPSYEFATRITVGGGLVAAGERPEDGQISVFGKDASGEWIYLTHIFANTSRLSYYRFDLVGDALAVSNPVHFPHVEVYDISDFVPDTGDGDSGSGDDSSDAGDDDGQGVGGGNEGNDEDGDDTGGDADTSDDDDDSGSDDDSSDAGDDDGQGVGSGNEDDDEGDDEGGDSDEGETGGGEETTPSSSGSGGGSFSWLLAMMVPLLFHRRRTRCPAA